jgi:hypothetical protein
VADPTTRVGARAHLESLVEQTIPTITGKPNTIVSVGDDEVLVRAESTGAVEGESVSIESVQRVAETLLADDEIRNQPARGDASQRGRGDNSGRSGTAASGARRAVDRHAPGPQERERQTFEPTSIIATRPHALARQIRNRVRQGGNALPTYPKKTRKAFRGAAAVQRACRSGAPARR